MGEGKRAGDPPALLLISDQGLGVLLYSNPVALISKPKQHKARDRRLAPSELERLDKAFQQGCAPLVRSVFLFAINTGMRRREIVSLSWANIDFDARTAHPAMMKNGHSRTVPLSSAAIEILKGLPHSEVRAFPITIDALRYGLSTAMERAGVKDLHLHDGRHEAISRFFELGLSVPEVSLISGHRDPRMLARYTHLKAENVAEKLSQDLPPFGVTNVEIGPCMENAAIFTLCR